MIEKVERYPSYKPFISVSAVEFIDVLTHINILDVEIDIEMDTVEQVDNLIDDMVHPAEKAYYRNVVKKWKLMFETTIAESQE